MPRNTGSTPAQLPADPLAALCRGLPGATEDIKWDDRLVFSVGGKMFAMFKLPDGDSIDFKADTMTFDMLSTQPGLSPAPYLARAEWLRLDDRDALDEEMLEQLLREAYQIVRARLPRRVQQQLPEAGVAKERE